MSCPAQRSATPGCGGWRWYRLPGHLRPPGGRLPGPGRADRPGGRRGHGIGDRGPPHRRVLPGVPGQHQSVGSGRAAVHDAGVRARLRSASWPGCRTCAGPTVAVPLTAATLTPGGKLGTVLLAHVQLVARRRRRRPVLRPGPGDDHGGRAADPARPDEVVATPDAAARAPPARGVGAPGRVDRNSGGGSRAPAGESHGRRNRRAQHPGAPGQRRLRPDRLPHRHPSPGPASSPPAAPAA